MQRFLLACSLSCICSIIALSIGGSFWWIGLLLGFVIGYLGYDIPETIIGIRHAFKKVRDLAKIQIPYREIITGAALLLGAYASMSATIFYFFMTFPLIGLANESIGYSRFVWAATVMSLVLGLVAIGAALAIPSVVPSTEDINKRYISIIKYGNPFSLLFWVIPRSIVWTVARTPSAVATAYRFCQTFIAAAYRSIHSDARVLFGIDVAIGTAIGYATNSALIGGLAGGCWWLLDWHLISVKLLRITPAK